MTIDPMEMLGMAGVGDAVDRLLAAVEPSRTITGWATVELDRAEAELAGSRRPFTRRAAADDRDGSDEILGARTRALDDETDPGTPGIVLMEPSTEGLLAAALARHGEGPIARYLLAEPGGIARARAAGFRLSAAADGPFGRQRLVVIGPRSGPFVLLVDAAAVSSDAS